MEAPPFHEREGGGGGRGGRLGQPRLDGRGARERRVGLSDGERKLPVSIRLDREVIDFFREEGPGYQSRISAVLLSYVRSRRGRG